jgi:hypothetical protein
VEKDSFGCDFLKRNGVATERPMDVCKNPLLEKCFGM